jgi:hypothetical protein
MTKPTDFLSKGLFDVAGWLIPGASLEECVIVI